MWDNIGGAPTFSYGPFHTDTHVWDDQLELIYNSSSRAQDVAWKTCRKQWMIGTDGEKELWNSLRATHDNDDGINISLHSYLYKTLMLKLIYLFFVYIYIIYNSVSCHYQR